MTIRAFSKLELGPQEFTGEVMFGKPVVEGYPIERARLNFLFGDTQEQGYPMPYAHTGEDYGTIPPGREGIAVRHCARVWDRNHRIWRLDKDGIEYGMGNGNAVAVQLDYPWILFYLHLRDDPNLNWDENDIVDHGDLIGRVGNTGNSTGAHLHLGLWQVPYPSLWGLDGEGGASSKPVDPRPYFVEEFSDDEWEATEGWVEPRDLFSQEEWETQIGALAYWDTGSQLGTAVGDLDARVKIIEDGESLVRVTEVRERLT